jgi:hypothetical protein
MQKVWLGIFLAMFVVPEVLWSPVVNFIYSLYTNHLNGNSSLLRNNFLQNPDNVNILSTVLFIQMAGLLFSCIYLIIIHSNIKNKALLWASCVLLFLAAVVVFFLFGFSVSLRHIGF